jgi:hypothetical protein
MIGNSGAPLEHLASVTACKPLAFGCGASRPSRLGTIFFAHGAEGDEARERALGSPTHHLAHRGAWRRRAGRGGGSAPPLVVRCSLLAAIAIRS